MDHGEPTMWISRQGRRTRFIQERQRKLLVGTPRYRDTPKGANWEFVGTDKEYSSKGSVNIFRRIKVETSEVGKEMPI